MPYQFGALSYFAASDIHVGRALTLRTDGRVEHMSALSQDIIGWSITNVPAGQIVSVRGVTDGTIECEVQSQTLFAGQKITIDKDGYVIAVPAAITVSAAVTQEATPSSGHVTFTLDSTVTASSLIGRWVAVRTGTFIDKSYRIVSNTTDTVVVEGTEDTAWSATTDIIIRAPMMGYCIEKNTDASKRYVQCLMLRQVYKTDRQ